jgi:hypothetical protein
MWPRSTHLAYLALAERKVRDLWKEIERVSGDLQKGYDDVSVEDTLNMKRAGTPPVGPGPRRPTLDGENASTPRP